MYKQLQKSYNLPPSQFNRFTFQFLPAAYVGTFIHIALDSSRVNWVRQIHKYAMSLHLSASFLALENMCLLW